MVSGRKRKRFVQNSMKRLNTNILINMHAKTIDESMPMTVNSHWLHVNVEIHSMNSYILQPYFFLIFFFIAIRM